MKQPHRNVAALLGSTLLLGTLLLPQASHGQSDILPPPNTLPATAPVAPRPVAPVPVAARPAVAATAEETALAALVAEVVQQQAKIVENQRLIDDKLAVIAENLRLARIYVSRAR